MIGIRENVQIVLDCLKEIHLLKISKSGIHKEASYLGHYGFLRNHWEDQKKINFTPELSNASNETFLELFKNDNDHKEFQLKKCMEKEQSYFLKFLESDNSHTILY